MTREDAVTTLKDISEMVHKQKEIEKSTLYGILDSNNEPLEALDMAIKALSAEPCEDCISREEVCDYIAEFVNHEYATDREREMVKHIIGGIQHLPSIQPTAKENLVVEDCISRAELLKAVDTWDKFGCDADSKLVPYKDCYVPYIHYDDVVKAIKGMPSIQPKTGHWIATEKDWWKCSECGRKIFSESEVDRKEFHAWCGRCGAKMLPTDSDCDSCEYQNEVDGSNCYECVKGIRDNYTAEKE